MWRPREKGSQLWPEYCTIVRQPRCLCICRNIDFFYICMMQSKIHKCNIYFCWLHRSRGRNGKADKKIHCALLMQLVFKCHTQLSLHQIADLIVWLYCNAFPIFSRYVTTFAYRVCLSHDASTKGRVALACTKGESSQWVDFVSPLSPLDEFINGIERENVKWVGIKICWEDLLAPDNIYSRPALKKDRTLVTLVDLGWQI